MSGYMRMGVADCYFYDFILCYIQDGSEDCGEKMEPHDEQLKFQQPCSAQAANMVANMIWWPTSL